MQHAEPDVAARKHDVARNTHDERANGDAQHVPPEMRASLVPCVRRAPGSRPPGAGRRTGSACANAARKDRGRSSRRDAEVREVEREVIRDHGDDREAARASMPRTTRRSVRSAPLARLQRSGCRAIRCARSRSRSGVARREAERARRCCRQVARRGSAMPRVGVDRRDGCVDASVVTRAVRPVGRRRRCWPGGRQAPALRRHREVDRAEVGDRVAGRPGARRATARSSAPVLRRVAPREIGRGRRRCRPAPAAAARQRRSTAIAQAGRARQSRSANPSPIASTMPCGRARAVDRAQTTS